jgi:hypothetical protein
MVGWFVNNALERMQKDAVVDCAGFSCTKRRKPIELRQGGRSPGEFEAEPSVRSTRAARSTEKFRCFGSFWVMTPYSLVHFEGICCIHLVTSPFWRRKLLLTTYSLKMEAAGPCRMLVVTTLHGVVTQTTKMRNMNNCFIRQCSN